MSKLPKWVIATGVYITGGIVTYPFFVFDNYKHARRYRNWCGAALMDSMGISILCSTIWPIMVVEHIDHEVGQREKN